MVGGLKKGGGAGGKVSFPIMIAALQHFFELERLKWNLYVANKNPILVDQDWAFEKSIVVQQ